MTQCEILYLNLPMTAIYSEFSAALNTMRQSVVDQSSESSAAYGAIFEESLEKCVSRTVGKEQWLALELSRNRVRRAIKIAVAGEEPRAIAILKTAKDGVEHLAPATGYLLRSFIESAAALIDTRQRNWKAAEARLKLSIEIDSILEESCGWDILIFHKLQSVHNYIRLLIKSARPIDAYLMVTEVFGFASGNLSLISFGHGWDGIKNKDPRLIEVIQAQISAECPRLAHLCTQDVEEFYTKIMDSISPANDGVQRKLKDWLLMKQAVHNGNFVTALASMRHIFSKPMPNDPTVILWYATVQELLNLARIFGNEIELFAKSRIEELLPEGPAWIFEHS